MFMMIVFPMKVPSLDVVCLTQRGPSFRVIGEVNFSSSNGVAFTGMWRGLSSALGTGISATNVEMVGAKQSVAVNRSSLRYDSV